ncbi:hypothetical protein S40288_08471 [Stachybotrys chartarum IBT 40288]|nr:hypothetical protein S40288_08471 [Stachybotrys chartarum IBT 40288]
MGQTPVDGRTSHVPGAPPKVRNMQTLQAKPKERVKLRPASPPKVNPWYRAKAAVPPTTAAPRTDNSPVVSPTPTYSSVVSGDIVMEVQTPSPKRPVEGEQETITEEAPRSTPESAASSKASKKTLEDAAPRATEKLWSFPFGADVVVYAESTTFRVHRNIITPSSLWFRDNLPPQDTNGSPAKVYLPYAAAAVACCLKYMYTKRETTGIEICDPNESQALDIIHLPRCVLNYSAAICLGVDSMSCKLIETVEKTSASLWDALIVQSINPGMQSEEVASFMAHLHNALELVYSERDQRLMMPMRMAVAAVVDSALLLIIQQPRSSSLVNTTMWERHSRAICADQAEYRRLIRNPVQARGWIVPKEDVLRALVNDCMARRARARSSEPSGGRVPSSGAKGRGGLTGRKGPSELFDRFGTLGGRGCWEWEQSSSASEDAEPFRQA